MKPYTELAESYDYLLRHVDYDQWYFYISSLMIRYVNDPRTVLELGCGTGKFGPKFSAEEFIIYGIDNSLDMLRVAKIRAFKNFRVICADMKNFALSKKIDFIFSVHDTMNYFLTYSDLKSVLRSVRGVMHDKSIFMFDITTSHNIDKNFDGKTTEYHFRGSSIEWSNTFDRKKSLVKSTLTFTTPEGASTTETHFQRIYRINQIKKILASEKFIILDIFGDYGFSDPDDKTVMINFITRKS